MVNHPQSTETASAPDKSEALDFPRPPEFTDDALALMFAEKHVKDFRYVAGQSKWYVWTGQRWLQDDTLLAFNKVRMICRESAAVCSCSRAAKSLVSGSTVAAVERLSRSDRRLAASVDQFDVDPMLLNTPGGVVDLRTGQLRPHRPEDYLSRITSVGPAGACPTWMTFLDRACREDSELIAFLRRMAGYALTGLTREQSLFFLFGLGANGKSVFVNTIAGILGDYHRTAAIETFTESSVDRHPTELACLRGARLVTAVETAAGRRLNESRIKTLTGGDKIAARFMRQDGIEFTPQFKLLIAGNHKPSLHSVDEAIGRRVKLIPFLATIPLEERDLELENKLRAEWPGILSWIIEGCLEWQQKGLCPPAAVTEATSDYLESEDTISEWIADCCKRDPGAQTPSAELYTSYQSWAERAGEKSESAKTLTQKLVDRGCVRYRKNSERGLAGLRLVGSD